jgi:hypothetical protein
MAGYQATQIRKPENETEFEKNTGVLFRELLNDQNVQRLGRRGQRQYGIDLVGHRAGDARALVGVQCKLKGGNKRLSTTEVRTEVKKALTFKPALTEYFIVTTAPNDTKLTALAATLSKQQADKGRKILIEVWGWETLKDRINEHESAKNAFDPGFSPSLQHHSEQVEAIIKGHKHLATSAQIADIAAKLGQREPIRPPQLPPPFADREIRDLLSCILRRRGFLEATTTKELGELADRAIDGDLALASTTLKLEVLQRAARIHAQPGTLDKARYYLSEAKRLDPAHDTVLLEALVEDANGRVDDALRILRSLNSPDARTAIFNILSNRRSVQQALDWTDSGGYALTDFNSQGVTNVLLKLISERRYDDALARCGILSGAIFDEVPALYLIRANLNLAFALPAEQKRIIFSGLPINPRFLRLASDLGSLQRIKVARHDIQTLIPIAQQLKLVKTADYLEELDLWIQLEGPETREEARQKVSSGLADPTKTLRRIRLALWYDIPFNRDALSRHLRSQRELGGWSDDERFAGFLLAFRGANASSLASFFDNYRDELFAQQVLADGALAWIDIESLARAGRLEDARRRFEEHRQNHLSAEQADAIDDILTGIERGDETEQVRRRYENSKSLPDLLFLIDALNSNSDYRQLATYAPDLVRATHRVEDFRLALGALFNERRYDELLGLTDELPNLFVFDSELSSLKAWSLFHVGRVMEARTLVRTLLTKRNDPNDRELAINTAIESGDWGYLQSILITELARVDEIDPKSLVRLSRLALEVGSPYVDQFRDTALAKANEDPEVHLAAYMLSVERGDESQDIHAHEWLTKAARLSGPDGPVQEMPPKHLLDHATSWNTHVSQVDKALREGRVPLVLAAHALRRQPMDFVLGQASRNASYSDIRWQSPILAFSGLRPAVRVDHKQRIALDLTTIFTLEYLGLLERVITTFSHVMIAPSTLSTMFTERQFLRVRQPSECAKAKRIQGLIFSGLLRLLPLEPASSIATRLEIDDDLAYILSQAKSDGALVVRPGPVFKRGSLLEATADLSSYHHVIVDTHAVLKYLSGSIESSIEMSAASYLQRVDKGWSGSPAIGNDSTLYLDDLAVIFLDHARILEPLARTVRAVYVSEEMGKRTKGMLHFADQADSLVKSVERIRGILNKALEAEKLHFSRRRQREPQETQAEAPDTPLPAMPALDIMSSLAGVDAIACDDRFLNKEPVWSDSTHSVETVNSLDLLRSLVACQKLSAEEYRFALHKLRIGGYHAVPVTEGELLEQIDRAFRADGTLVETPELRAIRENISISRRSGTFMGNEATWLSSVRLAFVNAIRELWQHSVDVSEIIPKADWLLAFLPDPLVWCPNPEDESAWAIATQQAAGQYATLLSFFATNDGRNQQYAGWIEKSLIEPIRHNQPWLWQATLTAAKSYVRLVLEAANAR